MPKTGINCEQLQSRKVVVLEKQQLTDWSSFERRKLQQKMQLCRAIKKETTQIRDLLTRLDMHELVAHAVWAWGQGLRLGWRARGEKLIIINRRQSNTVRRYALTGLGPAWASLPVKQVG